MKKNLSKIELKKSNTAILSSDELNQLKGGGDVYNTNGNFACSCDFKNYSVTYNQNSAQGCSCNCTM